MSWTSYSGVYTCNECNFTYLSSPLLLGLDLEKDKILEMACVITDADLNVLKEVIKQAIGRAFPHLNNWSDTLHLNF